MKNNNSNNHSPPVPVAISPSVPAKRSPSLKNIILPVTAKSYPNSDTCKAPILSENKHKSGIYM